MTIKNRIGNLFSLTSFGESHGVAIGGVIDGMPAGFPIDMEQVQRDLARRRPGQSAVSTSRTEEDKVEILSGILNGITLGTPIGFIIKNTNRRSADYSDIQECYRPNHADYTYDVKYGLRDARGGGRSSARETACRVVAGSFARQVLGRLGVQIVAYTTRVGDITLSATDSIDLAVIEQNTVRCPNMLKAKEMEQAILTARSEGDTLGGVVRCEVNGMPAGIGEPVFGKLSASLAEAMMSINAAKGFEIGDGFNLAGARGSEVSDTFVIKDGKITTASNHSGGIQGGISNGSPVTMNIAFKPVATLMCEVETIDRRGNSVKLQPRGRHDPCVVPRAVPIVEAMAAIVILDNMLMGKTVRFENLL